MRDAGWYLRAAAAMYPVDLVARLTWLRGEADRGTPDRDVILDAIQRLRGRWS